ncbi:MAG: tRNA-dihydrouridine synthase family protein [Firmicutes bacterium]|nr:tRNA-dihydrouridine synthase family protein [Bacillota bacterium]
MKIYFAPLEGITGYIQRQTFAKHFGCVDKYFIPFIQPKQHGHFTNREKQDMAPEHNEGLTSIPQLLTNSVRDFLLTTEKLQELGYTEVNLNLGCPARTVVSKGRGSGQLADPNALEQFLIEVFEKVQVEVSIKTRIGVENPLEFETILPIFQKFPLKELIVHPRVQKEMYTGTPHKDIFEAAMAVKEFPVCYNGDIFSKADYEQLVRQFPTLDHIMIGRGLLQNPTLAREIQGGAPLTKEEVRAYHDELYARYQQVMFGDKNLLFKMKEFWVYQMESFNDTVKATKKIRKAQRAYQYEEAVNELFEKCDLIK